MVSRKNKLISASNLMVDHLLVRTLVYTLFLDSLIVFCNNYVVPKKRTENQRKSWVQTIAYLGKEW